VNAVVLGHAGIAVLLDSDAFAALDVRDSTLEQRPLHPAEIPSLLSGRPDLEFLEDLSLSQVRHELLNSWKRYRALDLVLIILDGEAEWATRREAASHLETLLTEQKEIGSFLRRIFSARPLPRAAHLDSAFHAAESANAHEQWHLLRDVELAQPALRNWRSRVPPGLPGFASPGAIEAGFTPLFDGTQESFDRWQAVGRGAFELDAEHLVTVPGADIGLLFYKARMFSNFILRVEFQVAQPLGDHNDNSGIFIRFRHPEGPVPDPSDPRRFHRYHNQAYVAVDTGLEVQIDDMARGDSRRDFHGIPQPDGLCRHRTGAIYDIPAGDRLWHHHGHEERKQHYHPAAPLIPGAWSRYEIEARGTLIVVRLDDVVTTRYENTDPSRGQAPGFIGLQAHRGHVRFANVRIKEI
jgi:hypothetical protein